MSVFVLAATPTVAFGELIRHSLEESGRYQVQLVHTPAEARAALQSNCRNCSGIAILDSDLSEASLRELAEFFDERVPGMRLVVIPPENNPQHLSLAGVNCAAYLRKPFYLPDLIELMDGLSAGLKTPPSQAIRVHGLEWISQDTLERLVSATSALGVLLTRREGASLLCGALPDQAGESLISLAGRFWQRSERSDLVRFARLPSSDLDTLIYLSVVTPDGDTVLGAIYPGTTPLSKVRAQTIPLIQTLREMESGQALTPASRVESAPSEWELPPTAQENVAAPASTRTPSGEEALPDEESAQGGELRTFDLSELLGVIPSPDPGVSQAAAPDHNGSAWLTGLALGSAEPSSEEEVPAEDEAAEPKGELPDLDADAPVIQDEQKLSWEQESEAAPRPLEDAPAPASLAEDEVIMAKTVANTPVLAPAGPQPQVGLPDLRASPLDQRGSVSLADDRTAPEDQPERVEEEEDLPWAPGLDQLEPASGGISYLNYTCVMIPRLPQHVLSEELSAQLAAWMRQLCLAFGWRLEKISLHPEYFQWTVQVAPSISPGNVVKIVRLRTSEYIFNRFDALRQENPSGDFWASGYLILSGAQPPSARLLRDTINQIRRRQGIGRDAAENQLPF